MAMAVTDRKAVLERLLDAAMAGDIGALNELVTDDVVGWSPHLLVTSRSELAAVFERREDAFSNIDASIDSVDGVGDKVAAEWHVAVDHTGPIYVDDDLAVEPTGRRLHLAGATFAEFEGDRIKAFRHYFDDLALLEQALLD